MTKPIVGVVEVPEPQFHYYGSTAYNWCRDDSVENVLLTLARMAGSDAIKRNVKGSGGLYSWICKVEAPRSTSYDINFFAPVGVEISESWEFNIMNTKGHCLPITREKKNAEPKHPKA